MRNTVLVIGSGGKNKLEYLTWLGKLGAKVIVLEPQDIRYDYPENYEIHFAPFTCIDAVVGKAREIAARHIIADVDTVFEPTLEHAAFVRQALGLRGLTPEQVKIGRSKTVMAKFMLAHDVRNAPHMAYDSTTDLQKIKEQMKLDGNVEWILRPDNLASNIGIRKIKNPDELQMAFDSAQDDMPNHQHRPCVFDLSNKWMISHFMRGHELEAEVCIHKGEIVFSCPLFKTIVLEKDQGIEENRCVMPIPWLSSDALKDMNIQIQKLAKAVYQEIMKPGDRETMIVYMEFRIDKNNQAYVLEFAFRNGGYINPLIIEISTGINPYYLSAAATLGIEPKLEQVKINCAAGYQSIYADRKGIYEGVSGVRKLKGVIIKEEVPLGYEISIPHSEMVMNVMASAPTPEGVDRLLNDALRDAKVMVDGKTCGLPLSKFAE